MRISLPLMLTASLTLHGGVLGGFAWSRMHTVAAPTQQSSTEQTPTIILLSSEETPDSVQPVPVKSSAPVVPTIAVDHAPVVLSTPPQPVIKAAPVKTTPPPLTLALEMNPNAHIRELPPEAVLSPSPAPRLNGRDGTVFILDISGSMYETCAGSTRLAMARGVLTQQIRALKDGTPFAITLYSKSAKNSGPLVAASNATREAAVRFINEDIDCGGGTDLPAGLASAMELGVGHLVLVSDGDLNTNLADLTTKAQDILNPADHGPALTVIGISPRSNTDDQALLKSLAKLTGGSYVAAQTGDQAPLLTSAKSEVTAR